LGAAADTAADQSIDAVFVQKLCQRAMAAAVGADDFCFDDVSVFDVVNFKEFGVSEVLKDVAVLISAIFIVIPLLYCDCYEFATYAVNIFSIALFAACVNKVGDDIVPAKIKRLAAVADASRRSLTVRDILICLCLGRSSSICQRSGCRLRWRRVKYFASR
jgi:hypothetical protein